MMERRRALMAALKKEWDFEWYYTDGVTPAQVGWTKKTAGSTPVETLQSDGLKLIGTYYDRPLQISNGIIEVKFYLMNVSINKNRARIHIRIGPSASNCLYVECRSTTASEKRINLVNNSTVTSRTKIGTWVTGSNMTLRLTIKNGIGTVELDDTVIASNVDTSTMYDGGTLRCGNMTDVNENVACVLKYIKYKVGGV